MTLKNIRSVVMGILAIVWGGLLVVLSTYLQENHGHLKFFLFSCINLLAPEFYI
jgi:hypothetical protein